MNNPIIPLYPSTDKIIVKSEGCYLYDSEGKQYIDFEAGVWCTNLGHCNTQINTLIEKQINTNIHHGYQFRNEASEKLANKLNQLLGFSNGKSFFLSSGSEAVNLSISIARHLTVRNKILKVDNSFLSAYGYGRLTNDNEYKVDIPINNYDAISKIDFSDIAAFVIELGGASVNIVQFPEQEFIQKLIIAARKQGCLIICDEVTTGFGRTGTWFGFQQYSIDPDIVVLAKGLGNGYPISAVAINSIVDKRLLEKPLNYAQSHINDPLGCAISLEIIGIFEQENIILKAKETGQFFLEQLNALKNKYPKQIYNIRGKGLMLALEFSDEINGDEINQKLFEKGIVITCKNNSLRFLPPLIIARKDIARFIAILSDILEP